VLDAASRCACASSITGHLRAIFPRASIPHSRDRHRSLYHLAAPFAVSRLQFRAIMDGPVTPK
jgi:hypothetical protein